MQVDSSYIFQNPYSQPVQVGRPDPAMRQEQNQKTEEQMDQTRENVTELMGAQSKKDQAEIYIKSSAMYQNDPSYSDTQNSVKMYMDFSKDIQRSQNINTYVNNGGDFAAMATIKPEPLSV